MDDRKLTTHKLEGEALEFARQWSTTLESFKAEMNALSDEVEARRKDISERHNAVFRECWNQIAARLGLDPAETWGNARWGIDTQYLEAHGDAFIVERPAPPPNPMAALFGGEPVEEQAEVETAPVPLDKSKMH